MPWAEFHPELGTVGIDRGHVEGDSRASRTQTLKLKRRYSG
jgi:hypothetical protein